MGSPDLHQGERESICLDKKRFKLQMVLICTSKHLHQHEKNMNLNDLKRGEKARITAIHAEDSLMRKLLEMGLHEGMDLRLAHTGPFGRDPMAIEIADRSIALRRRDASHITIEPIA